MAQYLAACIPTAAARCLAPQHQPGASWEPATEYKGGWEGAYTLALPHGFFCLAHAVLLIEVSRLKQEEGDVPGIAADLTVMVRHQAQVRAIRLFPWATDPPPHPREQELERQGCLLPCPGAAAGPTSPPMPGAGGAGPRPHQCRAAVDVERGCAGGCSTVEGPGRQQDQQRGRQQGSQLRQPALAQAEQRRAGRAAAAAGAGDGKGRPGGGRRRRGGSGCCRAGA